MFAFRRLLPPLAALPILFATGFPSAPFISLAAEWVDQRPAGPFLCRAEFPISSYEPLVRELEQLQLDVVRLLKVGPSREIIELCLFRDERTYRSYLHAQFPGVPYRRALFVKGNGPGKVHVYRSKEFAVDVRHESTHALLHAAMPMVPLWLDEGLAEYFEVPLDQRASDNAHLKKLKLGLMVGLVPHLERLEAKHDIAEMTASDYRYAWAWVHFMLHGPPEAHDELVHFLSDIQASTPPGRLSQRLERRLPGIEKRLVRHFRTWKGEAGK